MQTRRDSTHRRRLLHWLALAFLGLLGTVRCVVGVLYQGWMSSYYPREALTTEVEQQLLHRALAYAGGALVFLILLVVSTWKAVGRMQRMRSRATSNPSDRSVDPPP